MPPLVSALACKNFIFNKFADVMRKHWMRQKTRARRDKRKAGTHPALSSFIEILGWKTEIKVNLLLFKCLIYP